MKRPNDFTKSTILAFLVTGIFYVPVCVISYLTYGDSLQQSIINSLQVILFASFNKHFLGSMDTTICQHVNHSALHINSHNCVESSKSRSRRAVRSSSAILLEKSNCQIIHDGLCSFCCGICTYIRTFTRSYRRLYFSINFNCFSVCILFISRS